MQTHPAKRVEIIIESMMERRLTEALLRADVTGFTVLPVLGVPVQSRALQGLDSLLSIVQMPGGIPVATLAIGTAGAKNAGLLASRILATEDASLRERLRDWMHTQTNRVLEDRDL